MFTGDNSLETIQTEAKHLVDSILEESVTIVNNTSNQPQDTDTDIDSEFKQPIQPSQLPLIHINSYNVNTSSDQYYAQSDEISENFAIKSDCDIIVKSPTIESMSGKSFDEDFNFSNVATNVASSQDEHNALDSTLISNTATNILDNIASSSINALDDQFYSLSNDPGKIVRNLSENKLRRVDRKFEHLSSEQDDENADDIDQIDIDNLVNTDDISQLQNEFSKISWDESLSGTTGDYVSTPDNDLHDLTNAGDD